MQKEIVKQYFNDNKELTLLIDREPIIKEWTEVTINEEDCYRHKGNLGWKLGVGDLVVDVDPRNNGDVSFKKLCNKLGIKLIPTVITASGGYHYYLKIPAEFLDYRFKKTNREYPGIDFLTKGMQCVIPSAVCVKKYPKDIEAPATPEMVEYKWYDEDFGCFEQKLAPEGLINVISYKSAKTDEDFGISNNSNWTEEKIRKMLNKLDPSMHNDDWVKVGMALYDWDPICGFDLWEEWSKPGETYKEEESAKRWKSFEQDDGRGVTLGTVFYMVKEVNMDETIEKVHRYVDKIKNASEKDIRLQLVSELKKENFAKIDLETIAKAIKDRYKELNGVNMPIGNLRAMIQNQEIVSGKFIDNTEKPEWCKDWIYINSHAGFMNINTLKVHKAESFNVENGVNVPVSEGGGKCSAMKYISDNAYIDKVESTAYLPQTTDLICKMNGYNVLNIFNPNTTPLVAEEYTEEGLEYIERVKKHISFIFTDGGDAEIFTQYLAHLIQFPGKQILWSPVIQSIQGVGKSFFGELLRACLGNVNVGVVSPNEVVSQFNGWATGVQVNVLEEIRIKGHNRYDAVNALKPLITDRNIQINEKNVKPYMTYNTVNYICFTNYKDAIPMDGDDRRWWVIFVPLNHISELHKFVGEHKETYFPKLFDNLLKHSGEVRKWLLEYQISKKFFNIKQAPMTTFKELMIATEETGFEGLIELKDLIKKGGDYFNDNCISSSELFNNFSFEYPEVVISDNKKHLLLKKLGYMMCNSTVKINGKSRRIWTKSTMTNEEIRKSFEDL